MCFTYRDVHAPQLSSHLASHLQRYLGSHSHDCLRFAYSAGHHTLAGSGTVHTEVLLDAVVLVLPVAGKNHYHLTHTNQGYLLAVLRLLTTQIKAHTHILPDH